MNYLSMAVKIIIAIPQIKSLFDSLISVYEDYKIKELENNNSSLAKKRKALINAISKASNNEERKELSIILHDYTSGKLSDTE